jgi:Zn-dependent peptidase ImmA (M78 family)
VANTVRISNNILNWVSETTPLSDQSRKTLESWLSGEKQPTFNQLEKLSKMTHIPLGYFFLSSPPIESLEILEFRTIDSQCLKNPSRDLIDTVRQMENVQDWMREYIFASGMDKISFFGSLDIHSDSLSLATATRKTLSLEENWFEGVSSTEQAFKDIRQAVSDVGVIVMLSGIVGSNTRRPLSLEEFRAFTLIDEYAPLIFINSTDSKSGMLFSLLHEFIHIGVGKGSLFNAVAENSNFVNPNEVISNAVTAEILVPNSLFIKHWQMANGNRTEKVQAIASRFKCSQLVIARRALDLGYISSAEYKFFVDQAKENVKSKPARGGGNYYKTLASRIDHKFLSALNASLLEGETLYTDAFRLTNTNRSTYDNLISEALGEQK